MKSYKSILTKTAIALLLGVITFGTWYTYTYTMKEARSFDVNKPESSTKLLIATQGSEFKDTVVSGIIDHFDDQNIFIKVIDVYKLKDIDINDWNAVCLIHTWEFSAPPTSVKKFIKRLPNLDRLAVLTTSGNGTYKMEGIDAITGASVLETSPDVTSQLINKIETILRSQKNNTFNFSFQ